MRDGWNASLRALAWCAALILPVAGTPCEGDDWPTYRADSARGGYTTEELPAQLQLQWRYRSPHPPEPAWPDVEWQRMPFDFAYQVVVADGTLYYGSSADCQVYAVDAATGAERWRSARTARFALLPPCGRTGSSWSATTAICTA